MHANMHQPRDLFRKIKFLTKEFKAQTWATEDQNSSLKTDVYEIAETWRQYCQKLYSKADIQEEEIEINERDNMEEPNILKDEIQAAIKKVRKRKSTRTRQFNSIRRVRD
jgi:hypothetical protein